MKKELITTLALVLYQIVFKRNAKFIKPTLHVTSLDIKRNVTLTHVKQHLTIDLEIIESRPITLNIKLIWKNNIGKSRSAIKHQNLHGNLSEYVILTIQTVRYAYYV